MNMPNVCMRRSVKNNNFQDIQSRKGLSLYHHAYSTFYEEVVLSSFTSKKTWVGRKLFQTSIGNK